jgi:hypothetical protein
MIRTTITTVFALGLAALLAWRLGGVVGTGVLVGAMGGATVASVGASLQLKIAKTAPKRLFPAFTVGFLLKMFAALAGALAFRYVPEAAALCDWRSFLLAFAVCAIFVMMAGMADLMKLGVHRAPVPLDEGQA